MSIWALKTGSSQISSPVSQTRNLSIALNIVSSINGVNNMVWMILIYVVSIVLAAAELIREKEKVSNGIVVMVFVPVLNTLIGLFFIVATILDGTKNIINKSIESKNPTKPESKDEDNKSQQVL